jgi:predicted PurR-regulated permease PerM
MLLLCMFLLRPFVAALTGAGLLAFVTRRPFEYLRKKIRNRTATAVAGVFCVALGIVTPFGFFSNMAARRTLQAIAFLQSPAFVGKFEAAARGFHSLLRAHGLQVGNTDFTPTLENTFSFLGNSLIAMLSSSVAAITQVVVMLFLLFFWYRDSQSFRRQFVQLLPLAPSERRFLARRVRHTIQATLFGRFVVAAVQGLLAWCTFALLGIPGAALLANLTAVCAIFPAVGAYFVWVPVMAYLALIHEWAHAIILLLVGTLVLSTVDNILYPMLVGARAHIETAQMFLSVFGGVWLFGVSGLILGPLIWILAEALLAIWTKRERQRAASSRMQ